MKITVWLPLVMSGFLTMAVADNIDYSVADWGSAEVRKAGDGTIFVNYNYYANEDIPLTSGVYDFTLYLWVERGGAATPFPTPSVPIQVRKLSGQNISHWFTVTPSSVIFTGYGTDPDTLGLPPNGLYVTTRVSFVVHPESLNESITQVKIQTNTAGIPNLGNGHGVIVRLIREGNTPSFDVSSWITDSNFVPIDTFLVTKKNCNCCRCRRLGYCCCGCANTRVYPSSFWYNVFVTNYQIPLPALVTQVNPIPTDFIAIPYNNNATYVWLVPVNINNPDFSQAIPNGFNLNYGPTDIQPHGTEFMVHRYKYNLGVAPVESLPKTYVFSASASSGSVTLHTNATLSGKFVTKNCSGNCGCGGGGGCEYGAECLFGASICGQKKPYLEFSLPNDEVVRISVYTVDGREIKTINQHLTKGSHKFSIANGLVSGVYFCRIDAGKHKANLKFVIVR